MTTPTGLTHASASVGQNRAVEVTRAVMERLFERRGMGDFAVRLWDGQTLPAAGGLDRRFTLVLTHPGALRRMFFPPGELTLAEAYLRGDVDIEGDMVAAAHGFERGDTNVFQVLLSNSRSRVAEVPLTRADLYASPQNGETAAGDAGRL